MNTTKLARPVSIVSFSAHDSRWIGDHLRNLQYSAMGARNLGEALSQIRTIKPSVVFLDSETPGDVGETILKTLSQHVPNASVVLLITGDTVPEKFGSIHTAPFALLQHTASPEILEHVMRQVESNSNFIEQSSRHFRNSTLQNAALEAHVQSLERQNLKLQHEHKRLSKVCSSVRREERDVQAVENQMSAVQVAIDSTREAVLILDIDGRVQYSNRAFEDAFGRSPAPGEVFSVQQLFATPGIGEKIQQNIDTLGAFSCEVSMLTRDGKEFPAFVNANAVGNEHDGHQGMLFLITDLTEQEQLRKEAHYDALTGLYTRRHFMEHLDTHTSMAARHEQALSVCLCDLDNFKQVNDTYGHRMGDRVLETFARIVMQEVRREDCAGRIGGDEYIITFPQVPANVAATCMERIRTRFEAVVFKTVEGVAFQCSATLGLADYPYDKISNEAFIELADKSLYHAKELGRNCTVVNMEVVSTTAA